MSGAYSDAGPVVTGQRCGFGDDDRGYCGLSAAEHIYVDKAERQHTMACALHSEWFDRHSCSDRHPVGAPCGLPGATWRDSHPTGGPGWCELDGFDWLAAMDSCAIGPAAVCGTNHKGHT